MGRKVVGRPTRRHVRERAQARCEYCQSPDGFASGPFACEHVIPQIKGAGDSSDDLAWACAGCNGHKYNKSRGADPETGRSSALFHPRKQKWSKHFTWTDDGLMIAGLTATGRATVESLHLNRPELVNLRFALRAIGKHPPSDAQ